MKTKKVRPKSLYEIAWEIRRAEMEPRVPWEDLCKVNPEGAALWRRVVEAVSREVYRRMRKKEKA